MGRVYQMVQEAPLPELPQPVPAMIRFEPEEDEGFRVVRESEGFWRVHGGKIERAVYRTQTKWHDALLRLHRYLEYEGVLGALRDAGVQEGDTVRIGEFEFEWTERD